MRGGHILSVEEMIQKINKSRGSRYGPTIVGPSDFTFHSHMKLCIKSQIMVTGSIMSLNFRVMWSIMSLKLSDINNVTMISELMWSSIWLFVKFKIRGSLSLDRKNVYGLMESYVIISGFISLILSCCHNILVAPIKNIFVLL